MLGNLTGNFSKPWGGLFQGDAQQGDYYSAAVHSHTDEYTMPDDVPEPIPSSMGMTVKNVGQTFNLDTPSQH
jgi:hypothetical protein